MPEQNKRRKPVPFTLGGQAKGSMAMQQWLSRCFARWAMRRPPSPSAPHIPFQAIMEIAYRVGKTNPAALVDLIRLLGRKVQADRIAQVVMQFENTTLLDFDTVLFRQNISLTPEGQNLYDLLEERAQTKTISLVHDIVLPRPWSRGSMAQNLALTGTGKRRGPWRQDWNHYVEWYEPIQIGWVGNGNHSLAAGIVQGEGTLQVDEIYHMGRVYEHVTCDGSFFRTRHNWAAIADVRSPEFTAIFGIGRLLLSCGLFT